MSWQGEANIGARIFFILIWHLLTGKNTQASAQDLLTLYYSRIYELILIAYLLEWRCVWLKIKSLGVAVLTG